MRGASVSGAILLAACAATPEPEPVPDVRSGFVLQYSQDFDEASSLHDFEFTDGEAWVWNSEGTIDLVGPSSYKPPHRSPLSIALIDGVQLEEFVLEADLMQTGREYGHRDLCLFFGHVDAANFYYVHLATKPDQNAHNVFLVDDAPRRPLAPVGIEGVDWGEHVWHHVRLERVGGRVRVFFDDMETPLLSAHDETHVRGRIGFGSFDDEGRVDRVRIWAPER